MKFIEQIAQTRRSNICRADKRNSFKNYVAVEGDIQFKSIISGEIGIYSNEVSFAYKK